MRRNDSHRRMGSYWVLEKRTYNIGVRSPPGEGTHTVLEKIGLTRENGLKLGTRERELQRRRDS